MKEVTDTEIKRISFEILSEVTDYCDACGIQYFLICGTALGAVRHNGFIPWDDDIDIGIPRTDYERFIESYKSEKYKLHESRFDKNYPYAFAKVCDCDTVLIENIEHPCKLGIYIDIFPIDGLPDNEKERKRHLNRINLDLKILSWKRISRTKKVDVIHKIIQIIAKTALCLVPVSALVNMLNKDIRKYSYDDSKFVGHLSTKAVWGNDVKPKDIFKSPVKHRFEEKEFWLPGDFDKYLTLEYGDYMRVPPKEKQVSNHDFTVYYKDDHN